MENFKNLFRRIYLIFEIKLHISIVKL